MHTIVGKTDTERRVALNRIDPFWYSNECGWTWQRGHVRRIPAWYGTMYCTLYLGLLLIVQLLLDLIGELEEAHGQRDDTAHHRREGQNDNEAPAQKLELGSSESAGYASDCAAAQSSAIE